MAGALGLSLLVVVGDGMPGRWSPDVLAITAVREDGNPGNPCLPEPGPDGTASLFCDIGAEGVAPTFVLWGDSHAMALGSVVADVAAVAQAGGLFAGKAGCPPLIGILRLQERFIDRCRTFNDAVLDRIVRDRTLAMVMLAGRWASMAEGLRYKQEPGDRACSSMILDRARRPSRRIVRCSPGA